MATPGELVKVIAVTTGEDEATVVQHDRNLVIAGLRTKGGRGRSAAKVTPRDAAHLLTSVLGSHRVKDGVDVVRRYVQTQEHNAYWHRHYPDKLDNMPGANVWEQYGIPELASLPADHSFIDALTVLIALAAEGGLIKELDSFYRLNDGTINLSTFGMFDSLKIGVTSPRTHARISMHRYRDKNDQGSVQANYNSNEPPLERMKDRTGKVAPPPGQNATVNPKLDRWTETNARPIIYIGALLAGKLDQLPQLAAPAFFGADRQNMSEGT